MIRDIPHHAICGRKYEIPNKQITLLLKYTLQGYLHPLHLVSSHSHIQITSRLTHPPHTHITLPMSIIHTMTHALVLDSPPVKFYWTTTENIEIAFNVATKYKLNLARKSIVQSCIKKIKK